MINTIYAKAYTEVLEIIKYFPEEEYNKIPKEKIEFYESNKNRDYVFVINPEIDLSKQNISPEANAIIVNLFRDYFATEEQKAKLKEILDLNQQKEDEEKRKKYDSNDIFKRTNKNTEVTNIENSNSNTNTTTLIEYKESFFTRFKNFIFKILHIDK